MKATRITGFLAIALCVSAANLAPAQSLVHVTTLDTFWPHCRAVAVSGDALIVAVNNDSPAALTGAGLRVYDLSTPLAPQFVRQVSARDGVAQFKLAGDHLF